VEPSNSVERTISLPVEDDRQLVELSAKLKLSPEELISMATGIVLFLGPNVHLNDLLPQPRGQGRRPRVVTS
jgi:hypothetical protein